MRGLGPAVLPGARRPASPQPIDADVATVNAMRFSSIGVLAVGAAGVAVGSYLLVRTSRPPPTTGSVRVVPVLGAGVAGVTAMGRF